MRRTVIGLGVLAAVSGCGGGAQHRSAAARSAPVAEQVRRALADAMSHPALPTMTDARRPRLPFVAVRRCTGPGGAGRYRCATTPRGSHGMRSVAVQVQRDGRWSTEPLMVRVTFRGRRTTAATSVWGTGIRLPS